MSFALKQAAIGIFYFMQFYIAGVKKSLMQPMYVNNYVKLIESIEQRRARSTWKLEIQHVLGNPVDIIWHGFILRMLVQISN